MRFVQKDRIARISRCTRRVLLAVAILTGALYGAALSLARPVAAQNRASPPTAWTVTIILPPKLMAGHPATLAVLGVDGKLAAGVKVDLSDGQTVTTDRTGRAVFSVASTGDYLLARGSGASAAALIDPAVAASEPKTITLPSILSTQDRFWICGAGLGGEADANEVRINGQPALVMAASPICLVALPGPNAKPGPASISVEAPGVHWNATTTLVSLEFEPPRPALKPGQTGQLTVHAQGAAQKMRIVVQNQTPEVLKFVRGDAEEPVTSGGSENLAVVKVQAIASGDFSFSARLLPQTDTVSAARYLRAAESVARKEEQHELSILADRLTRHPRESQMVRAQLRAIATNTMAGDLRTLLDAARNAL